MAKLSEGIIARTLWIKYGIGQLAVPNIYYYAFESDLLILRKSGTVVEYEIKLSVQDFNAGLRKKTSLHGVDKTRRVQKILPTQKEYTRHQYLQQGFGANMFYYVAPEEVLEKVEIPEWAGVIRVRSNTAQNRCGIVLVKKAPALHKEKASENLKKKMHTSTYYKYWQHFAVKDINQVMRRTQ